MDVSDGSVNRFRYSFYSPHEIRSISVLEITNDAIFDSFTNRVVDGGLHDLSLGPSSERDLCFHCGLDYLQCPGHMGHIEFSRPVYNPLLFDLVVRLLKCFCFQCFRIYENVTLSACLELLKLPETLIPTPAKRHIVVNLMSQPPAELRKLALRSMTGNARAPCPKCASMSWMSRHLSHQQIELKPAKESKGRIKRAAKMNDELDDAFEPGEIEAWAEVEAQILAKESAQRPAIAFEDGIVNSGYEFDDLAESVRGRLKELCPNTKSFCVATPDLVRDMLRCLWLQESAILRTVLPFLQFASSKFQYPTDVCFMDVMPITPNICRWPRRISSMPFESTVTAIFCRVLSRAKKLRQLYEYLSSNDWLTPDGRLNVAAITKQAQMEQEADTTSGPNKSSEIISPSRAINALNACVVLLQAAVNAVYDMTRSVPPAGIEPRQGKTGSTIPLPGLKQRLDKKEGLFRMHIMGKRVNYSCRSVISPDPNLCVHEVGVPVYFAMRLSFPERVTAFNIDKLRNLVKAGPDKYPGAVAVETPDGKMQNIPYGDSEQAVARRIAMSQRLVTPQPGVFNGLPIIVRRHLEDGDFLLMNRQPTLHKPSMQAHRVRVIKAPGAKTLRMHYAICKAYNADFDGDEMNGHFPQSYQAKSELAHLSAVPYQYLAPKDGSPLSGLIQDHVIAAVNLTVRGRFLDEDAYLDLVYAALCAAVGDRDLIPEAILLPPAIIKPHRLWTGKQVVSTLLMNIAPDGFPFLNHFVKGKNVKVSMWAGCDGEKARLLNDVDLVVVDGYLASGMLDKAHIGSASGGLVHSVYEAYGPHAASQLLSGISRMADRFLKFSSFTMSLSDIMLGVEADKERRKRFKKMDKLGLCAFADAFGLSADNLTEEKIQTLYRKAHFAPPSDEIFGGKMAALDQAVKKRTHLVLDAVSKAVLPKGLYKQFPSNALQAMVQTGSKGGQANTQQMSVALGQIELEGRRAPLMLSGRSLPSFMPYDVRPRAGGFCTYRFLTSLPPQELFIHSMAGRDGLIDTACKTSRSGYLQRSISKHLEDLSVMFDGTVRDGGGSIIQFRYGDDGLDPCQAAFLNKDGLDFFAENAELLAERWRCPTDIDVYQRLLDQNPLPLHLARNIDEMAVRRLGVLRSSLSERKLAHLKKRISRAKVKFAEATSASFPNLPEPPCKLAADLRTLINVKIIQGLAPPGEPVGMLAAQSMGEPSTQMTLNTFHLAGKAEMNVTLGIPRLREVLMTGSADIATPCMNVPIINTPEAKASAEDIVRRIYRLRLAEVIDTSFVVEVDYSSDSYSMTFNFLPPSSYELRTNSTPASIVQVFEKTVFPQLSRRLTEVLNESRSKTNAIETFNLKALARQMQAEAMDEFTDGPQKRTGRDEWGEDDGAEAVRRRRLEAEDEVDEVEERSGRPREQLDEDDDEVAELREIGLDPEAAAAAAEEQEVTGVPVEDEDEDDEETGKDAKGPSTSRRKKVPLKKKVSFEEKKSAALQPIGETAGAEIVELERDEDSSAQVDELVMENGAEGLSSGAFSVDMDQARIKFVKNLHVRFTDYAYDPGPIPSWVKLTISMFDPEHGRISIDLRTLVQDIISKCVVSTGPPIKKSFIDKTDPNKWELRCEGVDFNFILKRPDVFDLTRLYSNQIHMMQDFFGIEAARATLVKEVNSVFGHYGIHIDSRHLSLMSDYLTKSGVYRAFNRRTMDFHPSPMQRVTFETATSVLKYVVQEDMVENTNSPSAHLVPGQLTTGFGTTCFDLMSQLTL